MPRPVQVCSLLCPLRALLVLLRHPPEAVGGLASSLKTLTPSGGLTNPSASRFDLSVRVQDGIVKPGCMEEAPHAEPVL